MTELAGTDLGTQTIVIEQGPVRAFAAAVKDQPDRYTGKGAPTPPDVAVRHGVMAWADAAGEPVVTETFTLIVRAKKA